MELAFFFGVMLIFIGGFIGFLIDDEPGSFSRTFRVAILILGIFMIAAATVKGLFF